MTSATVLLEEGTEITFDSNEGRKGGGMALYGISSLKGRENCSLVFHNNSAAQVGGAIYYQPFEQREFIEGRTCFIEYIGNHTPPSFSFNFTMNTALLGGKSIFSVSFYSCFYRYFGSLEHHSLTDFFEKIGQFHFDEDSENSIAALATEGQLFLLEPRNDTYSAIPGKQHHIGLSVVDEFKHPSVYTTTGLEVNGHTNQSISQRLNIYYFSHKTTRLYGNPNENVSLTFNTLNTRDAYYDLNITLLDCPPGYILKSGNCECSINAKDTSYNGISMCNVTLFQAYIEQEFWAGYLKGGKEDLYTGPCSIKLCAINSVSNLKHLLPSNKSQLNEFMCGETKKGILCGNCKDHYSAYYHSNTQKCGPRVLCDFGIIFYILSEILPVTVLFILIIHFNISFTAGGISGFVFFSQMVVITPTDLDKILYGNSKTAFKILQTGHLLIYNVLNFNFLSIDELSFCLWYRAGAMDTLVIKYITSSFTVFLVFILIGIMNSRWYMKRNSNEKPRSVLHGLSAFLVLSYSQCASVTLDILSRTVIQSNDQAKQKHIAVTQHGGMHYFGHDHIPYAIPAIFFLIFFVILPPLLLLAYPLIVHLLALCNLSEHKITQRSIRVLQIHRLLPLFDSFQSCYKDKLRFFAGLYFIYKILILLCRSFTDNLTGLFAALIATNFFILGIHSIAQPYKKACHNVIDGLLFLNLGIINGLKVYNDYLATVVDLKNSHTQTVVTVQCAVQMVLTYVPIVAVVIWYAAGAIVKRRRQRIRGQYQTLENMHG